MRKLVITRESLNAAADAFREESDQFKRRLEFSESWLAEREQRRVMKERHRRGR